MSSPANENSPLGVTPVQEIDYAELLNRIQGGDRTSVEEFFRLFSRGVRFLLSRRYQSTNVEIELQSILSGVLRVVQSKQLSRPEQLAGFVLRTLKFESQLRYQHERQQTAVRAWERRSVSEAPYIPHSVKIFIETILRTFSATERDVLQRYYADGENQETICMSQSLSAGQFRQIIANLKSQFRRIRLADRLPFVQSHERSNKFIE